MHFTRERGFTLVEMLTVIAIMMILMGMIFTTFRGFGSVTAIEKDQKNLATLIGTARQKSISVVQWGADYPSYGVYVDKPSTVKLYVACNVDLSSGSYHYNGDGDACGAGQNVETLALTGSTVSSITYAPAVGGAWQGVSILFVRPNPIVLIYRQNGAQLQTTGTVTITLQSTADNTVTRTVSVNSNGHVSLGN